MWGRILGTAFGFIFAKLLGAGLGFVVGYWFDRKYGRYFSGFFLDPFVTQSNPSQEATFFYALFTAHGHLAKAKGRVTAADIAAAQELMTELALSTSLLQEAQDAFRAGKSASFPFVATLKQFRRDYANRRVILQSFMRQLISLLAQAGSLEENTYTLLLKAAQTLGFTRFEVDRWLMMEAAYQPSTAGAPQEKAQSFSQGGFQNSSQSESQRKSQKRHRRQESPQAALSPLQQAYKTLGLVSSVSDSDLKKAYRKLMLEHHPDKLAAQGLPEEMRVTATRRAQEVQAAYAFIRRQRGV